MVVVIINYKTADLIIDCLESLLPELSSLKANVIIVDNNSNDNSCNEISDWIIKNDILKKVELIASYENTGFSGGNNRGISHIEADYYLLLNSDTLLRKGAISLLLEAAKKDKSVGLVSPRLEWTDTTPQESCFRFHSPISELISSANTGLITRLFKSYNVPFLVSDTADCYDWTSFACVLVKSEVFKDIGLMDDGYFMYYEDVAFAYHAQKAGWKVLNVPDAHVVHLRGGSSPVKSQTKLRKRLPRYYYESRTRCFYQLYGRLGLLAANLLWTIGWGISTLRQLLTSSFEPSVSEAQWKDIWINFSNPLKSYIHPDHYDKS
ncbi:family 2 glycosyl transferase [Methyloprofundus sedimenti]|uniref:Family 2 glycosyl transferase n=1 Tax=Methyloprofundus sedimenti TaxID=1420851 RepID=A0A1V8MAP6_9GAMM|nr:family 2 glycosyl transferase [Methyloprofundus sedimenti]